MKPQYVDQIPRAVKGPVKQVKELIKARVQLDNFDEMMDTLGKNLFVIRWSASTHHFFRAAPGCRP